MPRLQIPVARRYLLQKFLNFQTKKYRLLQSFRAFRISLIFIACGRLQHSGAFVLGRVSDLCELLFASGIVVAGGRARPTCNESQAGCRPKQPRR